MRALHVEHAGEDHGALVAEELYEPLAVGLDRQANIEARCQHCLAGPGTDISHRGFPVRIHDDKRVLLRVLAEQPEPEAIAIATANTRR
jgi:hypothetical protein